MQFNNRKKVFLRNSQNRSALFAFAMNLCKTWKHEDVEIEIVSIFSMQPTLLQNLIRKNPSPAPGTHFWDGFTQWTEWFLVQTGSYVRFQCKLTVMLQSPHRTESLKVEAHRANSHPIHLALSYVFFIILPYFTLPNILFVFRGWIFSS